MCYNLSRNTTDDKIAQRMNKGKSIDNFLPQLYITGFGFPKIPVVKLEDRSVIGSAYWGFVPSHIKNDADAKKFKTDYLTLNAKSETVFKLPTYKSSIMPRRCLIPVTGFFEHRHIDPKTKIPYYIKATTDEIFCMAGIYNNYTNELGEEKCTVSILTTDANSLMAKVHNTKKRQPLVLDKELEEVWLDPGLNEPQVKELMKIFEATKMHAHPIEKISPKTTNFSDPNILNEKMYSEIND